MGGLSKAFLAGVGLEPQGTIPHLLFMAYQGTFAIITAALVSGAIVERMRFGAYLAFITLWSLVVYAPVAHWVWGGGFLAKMGALDFAGGTVVHVNAATAALVAAVVIGQRKDYARQAILPHNVPFTLLGAGLLWFGWFGFNAGSALAANGIAALAFVNTMLAPAGTLVVWTVLDLLRNGKATAVGAATGIVVGLVAITPAAGFIGPLPALVLGAVAAFPSYYALVYRARTRLDDSLDVVAAHGLGGTVGALLTGVFASKNWNGTVDGLLHGNPGQLGIQAIGVVAAIAYSGVASYLLLKAHRPRDAAQGGQARGGARPRREPARRGGLRRRRGRDPRSCSGRKAPRRPRFPRSPPRRRKEAAREARGGDRPSGEGQRGPGGAVPLRRAGRDPQPRPGPRGRDRAGRDLPWDHGEDGAHEKVRFDIGVSDHFVEPTVKAILAAARTGEVGDGKVFVLPGREDLPHPHRRGGPGRGHPGPGGGGRQGLTSSRAPGRGRARGTLEGPVESPRKAPCYTPGGRCRCQSVISWYATASGHERLLGEGPAQQLQ